MRLKGLMQPLLESDKFLEINKNIDKNNFPVGIYGISESAKAYLISGLYNKINKPILIITHSDVEARNLYEDLNLYIPNLSYFPTKELVFYNIDAISGDLRWERLRVLKEVLQGKNSVLITCVDALASVYTPVDLFKENIFKLSVGDILDIKELSEKLVQCGYERSLTVENKGQFSIRGGIIDIFPPIADMPYRIELFDDEIDSIRTFSAETQRSIEKCYTIEIFPAKEIILYNENLNKGYNAIKEDLNILSDKFKDSKKNEEVEKINGIIKSNLESLKERWSFETIDSYIPYFYEKTSTFFDYFKGAFLVMDDPQRCSGKIESLYMEFNENYENFLSRGNILPRQGELIISRDMLKGILEEKEMITVSSMPKTLKEFAPKSIVSFTQITLNDYHGQLDLLIDDIRDKKKKQYKILILSGTKSRGQRLIDTLIDRGVESVYKDLVDEIHNGEVVVSYGSQLKSYDYPDLKLCVISDKGVFGESKRKLRSSKTSQKGISKIKSFTELKLGDYVVHVNHGIGVYRGIKQLEVGNHKKDYLQVAYGGNDILYVPVEQLDLVQKYIGSEGKSPKVTKLSSAEWTKAKRKVKKSIEDIAEELIKLYAARSILKGYAFSKDTVWQKQFEEEFPFQETPDQLTAIEDIKKDMQSNKPMDRLLCGDVGYGKTEVALRAAFKSVMDGKQVAVLVPTTILAKQHYNNFLKRFSDFPVKIDMLSRFRTPAEQKKALQLLKEGNLDIIIGTHKILQKDVIFKDLGLLIVDEEQRFGVKHKEKVKELKKNIDVLTLSATPIPRTLHMSLTGVRDISVIETPPEERYPIQTYVVEFNEQLIRDAILREISRDGQIFFVYNRVETILDMSSYLHKLVPEARIAVAHGQMSERELENIMIDFIEQKYDLLLCTTIIETGIDVQNANTMIIYDADKMGLSQLYQLRGRVGRSNRLAYSYFTYKKDKVLTEVAEKRLKAIKEFTELGSGFKIAMRDLEIRGAGNMMGSSQHGHMSSVGYDLYCRMLEDTISKIKGDIEKEEIETTIEIKIDAYIPSGYIKDETQKIEVYKKIASISSMDELMDIQEEIEDRFSDIPVPVNNLINIAYLKSVANSIGIVEIKEVKDRVNMQFLNKDKLSKDIIKKVLSEYRKELIIKMGEEPIIAYNLKNIKKEDLLENLIKILKDFKSIVLNR
ncbi:transcription-repair coupling factor [Hathewaya histolytica]|uniref:Transcription-repair-coupling factor n=1 Tax=Hathewaya histolytica TaxID=1498 RepID=A0A4U9RUV7_HATHI|nr:transcription-repair coupling factor [Hathewaya histolytica]VTQ95426.1 transcription-repair coupling factor [Hathewaya histolytica]